MSLLRALCVLCALCGPSFLFAASAKKEAPPADDKKVVVPDLDAQLEKMKADGNWKIVLLDTPKRKITFRFGEIGRRVVELKWARDRNASLGEVKERVDQLYREDGNGDMRSVSNGGVDTKGGFGTSRSAQAYDEMQRTVRALNKGKFASANSHLTLMESASKGLEGEESKAYSEAAGTLRRAHALFAGDDALKKLVRAAERGDFREREALKAQLRAYGKVVDVDMGPYVSAAEDIWSQYGQTLQAPEGKGGDLKEALAALDAAEKLVQGPFKRGAYLKLLERVYGLSAGLTKAERQTLALRLKAHAEMWNKAAADTLAFSLLASLSADKAARERKDPLLDQAKWKGQQAARAHNLARALLAT